MHTFTLTVRRMQSDLCILAEASDSGGRRRLAQEPLALGTQALAAPALAPLALDREAALAYGRALGEAVFCGQIEVAFQRAQQAAETAGQPLHVLLAVEEERLKLLRWERLCARLDGAWQFLRLQQRAPFAAYVPCYADRRFPAIGRADLAALCVVADFGEAGAAYRLTPFDARQTVAGLHAALGSIPHQTLACGDGQVLPEVAGLPSLNRLCEALSAARYPILHVVCHGSFDKQSGETLLYLARNPAALGGAAKSPVEAITASRLIERLATLPSGRLPHLVFLACCESAAPEAELALGGLGQRLVRELGIPAVVAMTEPVSVALAQDLASRFYEQLADCGAADRAMTAACAGLAECRDVLVPSVYTCLAGQPLLNESGPLTAGQRRQGLARLRELAAERAPLLQEELAARAAAIEPLLDQDLAALAPAAQSRLLGESLEIERLSREVVELEFTALARGAAAPPYDSRCPFPGLGVFDKTAAGDFRPFFFGREELTAEIRALAEQHRFLAVLGSSGSGKSSLVRAGLLPAMQKDQPDLKTIVYPAGAAPRGRLMLELSITPEPDVVVIDQFEELFTLNPERSEREAFLSELLKLRDKAIVILTMRADFLGDCADHDALYRLLDDPANKHLKVIQPLRGDELQSVMERQAAAVGLQFEPGLSAQILADVAGEPGAMPLLQHCLRLLWQHRRGRWLRLIDYVQEDRVGGVRGAIARTAEAAWRREEASGLAELMQFVFEQLARIDTETAAAERRSDTRRRVELLELTPAGGNPQQTEALVHRLAGDRLLVVTQNGAQTEVEVAHEALIRHWPRLQRWLEAARVNARLVDRVRQEAARYGDAPANKDNLTLRGEVLAEAEALAAARPPRLNDQQVAFVRACRRQEQQRTRLAWWIAGGLAALLLLSVAGGATAMVNWSRAVTLGGERDKANVELAGRVYTGNIRLADASRREEHFTDFVQYLKDCKPEPGQPDLRDFEFYHLASYLEAEDLVLERFDGQAGPLAYAEASELLACGSSNGTASLWTLNPLARLWEDHGRNAIRVLAVSADGEHLAAGDNLGLVKVFDRNGKIAELGVSGPAIACLTFDPSDQGRLLIGTEAAKIGGCVAAWNWKAASERPASEQDAHYTLFDDAGDRQRSCRAITRVQDGVLAVFEDGSYCVCESADRVEQHKLGVNRVHSAVFMPGERLLAWCSRDSNDELVEFRFAATGQLAGQERPNALVPTPPRHLRYDAARDLVSGIFGDKFQTWPRDSQKPTFQLPLNQNDEGHILDALPLPQPKEEVTLFPRYAVATSSGGLRLSRPSGSSPTSSHGMPASEQPARIAWSNDGGSFAIARVGHVDPPNPVAAVAPDALATIVVCNPSSGSVTATAWEGEALRYGHDALAIGTDRWAVATDAGLFCGSLSIPQSGPQRLPLSGHYSLCLANGDKTLFVAPWTREEKPQSVEAWAIGEVPPRKLQSLPLETPVGRAPLLAASASGKLIAAANDRDLIVWDAVTFKERLRTKLPASLWKLLLTDEQVACLISTSELCIRSLDSSNDIGEQQYLTLPAFVPPERIALHPNLRRVAVAAMPGKIRLLKLNGEEVLQLDEVPRPGSQNAARRTAQELAFSPDGRYLVAVYEDGWQVFRTAAENESPAANP